MAMWNTGCRPGEVITLGQAEGSGFDEQNGTWTVLGKRTKRNPSGLRVVGLTPLMAELSKKLRQQYPAGALFRNSLGKPWNTYSLDQMFRRFRLRSAKLHPDRAKDFKKIMPYSCRHSFATNRLREGWSSTHVSRQMGNSPAVMHEHYDHVLTEEVRPMLEGIKPVDGETL